jgi:hypothetical protein
MSMADQMPLVEPHIPQIDELDLTAHGVLQHFVSSGRRGQLLTFLLALDRLDKWAVDFNEMTSPQAFDIQLYLQDLSQFVGASTAVLHCVPREFAEVLAHLTTTRCMYLIRYVAQGNPQFLDNLAFLIESEGEVDPNLAAIRRRFEAFSKARLLGEIFSGKRLTRIVSIMGSYTDD